MDWLERFNRAVDYIETHLETEMAYEDIARAACCSEFHFGRIFSSLTGVPLSEYIRRRRLSKAAFDIQTGKGKIIDIGLKYGYDSPDAFARAFKKLHGVSPMGAKESGVQLKTFPRISFQITVKGDVPMEYRLEEIDVPLRIVGKKFPVENQTAFKKIPGIWQREKKSGFVPKLIDMSWENPKCILESILAICGTKPRIQEDVFDYFMGVRYEGEIPQGMEEFILAPCTWAVFPNVLDAWKRLFTEWLPVSGYDLADLPILECHYPPDHSPGSELWVPVYSRF